MKRKIYASFLVMLMVLSSCEGFLEREPLDFVSPDNLTSENDMQLILNGAYRALLEDRKDPIYLDFMADNGFNDKVAEGMVEIWDQVHNENSVAPVRKWRRNYVGILRANTLLSSIDEIEMSDNLKEQYRSEALALRAFFYGDLIEFYGPVPLRLQPEGVEAKDSPRVSEEDILNIIIKDLDDAARSLPIYYSDSKDFGRITRGAALGIKARFLLYNKRWEQAAEACKQVMDLQYHELFDDYAGLFNPDNEYNKEILLDIQYIKDQPGMSGLWYTYFFQQASWMALANLEHEYYMTNGLSIHDPLADYDPQNPWIDRDPRLDYTLVLPYKMNGYNRTTGATMYYSPSSYRTSNFTSLRIRKWVDYRDDYVGSNSAINHILLRYADILLMRAEALNELPDWEAHKTEIIGLVNQIRQRPGVNMPKVEDVEGTNLTQEQLSQIIRHERRVEFAFEGTRMSDIKRWDIGESAYSDGLGYKPELLTGSSSARTYELYTFRERSFNKQKGYLWPIPVDEMQSNKAILENNPGY